MNEAWHRAVISGESRGWRATLSRWILRSLAVPYGIGARLRNLGFRLRLWRVTEVPVPVISLGNITAGGTGKTPFAAFIAQWFRAYGYRVAFLSRGYGADPGAVNDEALVLHQLCPDVPHLQNPDRVASARIAVEELESQLLILDDGFQHRRLGRDLDIILIDATNPWGYDALLPRGLLREPLSALRRAELIVLTRVDDVAPDEIAKIRQRLQRVRGSAECVEIRFPARRLVNSTGSTAVWSAVSGTVAAFCGIGNPAAFRRLLLRQGITVAEEHFRVYPDHHRYSREDVDQLRAWANACEAAVVLTTQKDLVKLDLDFLNQTPLWAVEIGTEIQQGRALLEQRLGEIAEVIPSE